MEPFLLGDDKLKTYLGIHDLDIPIENEKHALSFSHYLRNTPHFPVKGHHFLVKPKDLDENFVEKEILRKPENCPALKKSLDQRNFQQKNMRDKYLQRVRVCAAADKEEKNKQITAKKEIIQNETVTTFMKKLRKRKLEEAKSVAEMKKKIQKELSSADKPKKSKKKKKEKEKEEGDEEEEGEEEEEEEEENDDDLEEMMKLFNY